MENKEEVVRPLQARKGDIYLFLAMVGLDWGNF
jgi:hypothetical protein